MQVISKNDKVEVLRDIDVPKKFYSRISLGVEVLDEIFGGDIMPGVMPGCTYLFTGTPGAGKSTMSLQLADLFAKNSGRNVLYNIGEENRYMVKMRADRMGLSGNFCLSQITDVEDLMKFCEESGVEILFQDSLQTLTDGDLQGDRLLISVAEKLQAWKEKTDVTIFMIGHSTKGGLFAGPNRIKHAVDAHAHLKLDAESGNRVFEIQKNRFGPAAVPYEFSISSSGLDFQQLKVKEDDDGNEVVKAGNSRAEDRRAKVVTLIKDKLIEGEVISAYDAAKYHADCTDGFWRGMLSRACKELTASGMKIGEKKIESRMHYFVDVSEEK